MLENRCRKIITLAALGAGLIGTSSQAHHSYAMFDRNKTVELKGAVRIWQFINPHSTLFLYVKDARGKNTLWTLESIAPGGLNRIGIKKNTVNPGDKVTVVINPLRDGRAGGSVVSIRTAKGKLFTIGQLPGAGTNKGPSGPGNEPRAGERR